MVCGGAPARTTLLPAFCLCGGAGMDLRSPGVSRSGVQHPSIAFSGVPRGVSGIFLSPGLSLPHGRGTAMFHGQATTPSPVDDMNMPSAVSNAARALLARNAASYYVAPSALSSRLVADCRRRRPARHRGDGDMAAVARIESGRRRFTHINGRAARLADAQHHVQVAAILGHFRAVAQTTC